MQEHGKTGNQWAGAMAELLCEMNRVRGESMEQGCPVLPQEMITKYEENYFSQLKKVQEGNKTTADVLLHHDRS